MEKLSVFLAYIGEIIHIVTINASHFGALIYFFRAKFNVRHK